MRFPFSEFETSSANVEDHNVHNGNNKPCDVASCPDSEIAEIVEDLVLKVEIISHRKSPDLACFDDDIAVVVVDWSLSDDNKDANHKDLSPNQHDEMHGKLSPSSSKMFEFQFFILQRI